jgi:phosphopantetheine adenylyltransferase
MPEEHESKPIKVYGDKHFKEYAKTHPVPPAYERWVNARSVTFTCIRCHQEVTEIRYPGPTTYCAACSLIVKREKTAARVKRVRAKRKKDGM